MTRYSRFPAVIALAALLLSFCAAGQTLLVATTRGPSASNVSGTISGGLYTVNLASGTANFAAPLRMSGGRPVGVAGLATHPGTGTFYGITSSRSPNNPTSLVEVNPGTGDVSVIGELSQVGSDIVFDAQGTLYMWIPATHQIARVNLNNAAVTPLGRPGSQEALGGGLAIDSQGVAYVTPTGANGTLDTVDLKTGEFKTGPTLTGAQFAGAISAMTFTPSGLLLAVNSNAGSPAQSRLVTINTATGQISTIGALPEDSDALTFAPASHDTGLGLATMSGRTMALFALILGVVLALIGVVVFKWLRRKAPRPVIR